MKLRLTLTTLVTILLMATACASDPPPTPDTRETDRLSRQIQQLQAENEAVRNELATLTAAGAEQIQPPQGTPTAQPTEQPEEPEQRPIHDICDRSPSVQTAILSKLKLNRCSSVTRKELFRIEQLQISSDLKDSDLDGLVNLKELSISTKEKPLQVGIFANLVNLEKLSIGLGEEPPPAGILNDLGNLETIKIYISPNKPWDLKGVLTGANKLKTIKINADQGIDDYGGIPAKVNIQGGELSGLQELEAIAITGVESINGDPFARLESLNRVTLSSTSPSGSEPSSQPAFPQNAFLNNPNVKRWDIYKFSLAEEMPLASLEQFCSLNRNFGGNHDPRYSVGGEPVSLRSKDYGVCRVGVGEPGPNGSYPESQIKIVDGRPEATS